MAHSLLGNDGLRKGQNGGGWPTQYHAFDAIIMVQMGVQRCDRHIVLLVLQSREPTR